MNDRLGVCCLPSPKCRGAGVALWRLAFLVALAGGSGIASAQSPPLTVPESATDEDLQEVVVPLSEAVKRRIEEELRAGREASADARQPQSSGDPILDDVLEVIRRQGSVLDGSSLDPQSIGETARRLRARDGGMPPPSPSPAFSDNFNPNSSEARFETAEALLRASRMLGGLPGRDASVERLIAGMRQQAAVLLIDDFVKDYDDFE